MLLIFPSPHKKTINFCLILSALRALSLFAGFMRFLISQPWILTLNYLSFIHKIRDPCNLWRKTSEHSGLAPGHCAPLQTVAGCCRFLQLFPSPTSRPPTPILEFEQSEGTRTKKGVWSSWGRQRHLKKWIKGVCWRKWLLWRLAAIPRSWPRSFLTTFIFLRNKRENHRQKNNVRCLLHVSLHYGANANSSGVRLNIPQ